VAISSTLDPRAPPLERVLAALAEPMRVAILCRLRDGDRCVCDLESDLGAAQNLVSYHLRVLREAGLVESRRRGRRIEYALRPASFAEVIAAIAALAPGCCVLDASPNPNAPGAS
jgi:ArsR family transcriptional regulator